MLSIPQKAEEKSHSADSSASSPPASSPKRKLLEALVQAEDCQKIITTTEVTRNMSVFLVGNAMQSAMDSMALNREIEKSLNISDKEKK